MSRWAMNKFLFPLDWLAICPLRDRDRENRERERRKRETERHIETEMGRKGEGERIKLPALLVSKARFKVLRD